MTKLFPLLALFLLTLASCDLVDDLIDPIEFTITTPEVNFLLDEQRPPGRPPSKFATSPSASPRSSPTKT